MMITLLHSWDKNTCYLDRGPCIPSRLELDDARFDQVEDLFFFVKVFFVTKHLFSCKGTLDIN